MTSRYALVSPRGGNGEMSRLRRVHSRHPGKINWIVFCSISAAAGEMGLLLGKVAAGG